MAKAEIVLGELSGGGGGSETLLFYDITNPTITVQNGYNEDALTLTSGALRPNANSGENLTFTSKISGDLKWAAIFHNGVTSAMSLNLNGTNIILGTQPVHLNVGDVLNIDMSYLYNCLVVWVE